MSEAKEKVEKAEKKEKKEKAPKKERHSAINIAADILRHAATPMTTGEMMDAMLKKHKWETKGKTPAATLYSAILREMKVKGKASRFAKTERGKFAAVAV